MGCRFGGLMALGARETERGRPVAHPVRRRAPRSADPGAYDPRTHWSGSHYDASIIPLGTPITNSRYVPRVSNPLVAPLPAPR